jgi:hypothetical protein
LRVADPQWTVGRGEFSFGDGTQEDRDAGMRVQQGSWSPGLARVVIDRTFRLARTDDRTREGDPRARPCDALCSG